MTNLKETAQWEDGIYQLETSDPVLGGPDGIDNLQARQLANRTGYLKGKIEAQQKDKVSKAGDTMQGALRAKSGAATGNNANNAGFVFEGDADSGLFSPEDGKLEIAVNGEAKIVLIAGKGIFVKDWASFAAGVVADAFDQGGGQFRAIQGSYGAFLRNDGANVYLLSTKENDANGQWNDYRPLTWNLKSGYVTVDGTGCGVGFGGNVNVAGELTVGKGAGEGRVFLGPSGGYFFANSERAGYCLPNVGIFEYLGKDKTLRVDGHAVFHDGNLNPLDKDRGGDIKADVTIRNGDAEMHLRLGPVDGYWYSNRETWGFWSEKFGALQYFVADKALKVDGHTVWHEGTLTPLDKNLGGKIKANVEFGAGLSSSGMDGGGANIRTTGANFGVMLRNDDADAYLLSTRKGDPTGPWNDYRPFSWNLATGYVTVDGTGRGAGFGGNVDVAGFITAKTPDGGDVSTKVATTAWVTSAIASASIGQIVFEPRTAVRAGYVKCNGAELNRADYPALWAYAQASGALVEESDWGKNNWGCFSKGNGNTTFRIPELRGEFIRCWADGRDDIDPKRGIGTFRDSANRSHAHGASSSRVEDHVHSAWTDRRGLHNHRVNESPHNHVASNGSLFLSGGVGTPARLAVDPNSNNWISGQSTNSVTTGVSIVDDGLHEHGVGIGGAGGHDHVITVNADGEYESRPRSVAMLAMIRAY